MDAWIAGAVFLATYVLIATERGHKTLIAMLGGLLMIVAGVLTQEEAFAAIDLNVIFLLVGMIAIANVMRQTGIFQWLAIRAIGFAGPEPWRILVVLTAITAVASAFLDNVTTVILVGPITLYIAAALGVSAVPYLIAEILAANIGGVATLVGDPPNVLIASAAGYDFVTFTANMAPVAILTFGALLLLARILFAGELATQRARLGTLDLDASVVIRDRRLTWLSLAALGATVAGFVVAGPLGLHPATVALLGATGLLLVGRIEPSRVLAEVEWTTIFFFVGLFMAVEGLVRVGIISGIAGAVFDVSGGDVRLASIMLLWVSGIASAVIDNIPFTAAVIPIVQDLGVRGVATDPLWWSLALGADFGGNGTIIGASANVVVVGLAVAAGHAIRFRAFLRYGVPVMVVSLAISTVYVWLRYLA